MKHALLSASASHRWLVCHGSVAANKGKPHEQSIWALEGTSAHALLEVCLRLDADPQDFYGKVLKKDLMPVDDGMIDGVGYALDYIKSYTADKPNAIVRIEHPVSYGASIGCSDDEAFGTSDVIISDYPHEAVALDYKHGAGKAVAVKDNTQLNLYLVGERQATGRYRRYRKVVIQPRLRGRKPVQEAPAVTDAELMKWVDKTVRPVVPIALAKDAPRVAGAHCRWCVADGNCVAQYEAIQQAASKEFKNV